jgi:hypothetical protein
MSGETLWNRLVEVIPATGEEMKTGTGLWLKASSINGRLYVDRAVDHEPSSELTKQRSISKKDFMLVHTYYDRWVNGEVGVRHEVSRKSRNTAYIFAMINKYA